MTLQHKAEIIYGEPLVTLGNDWETEPCHEVVDANRICSKPLVSIHMVTFNHEKYIRQAIESVLAQEADFDFELVIGDDCSTDRTLEICRHFQAINPEKVRIVYGDKNLFVPRHPIGGNWLRVFHKCRGDYIALLEGDDYWTDKKKLQKQVDLLRNTDAVFCVAYTNWMYPDGNTIPSLYEYKKFLSARDFEMHYFHTSTYVFKKVVLEDAWCRFPGFLSWDDTIVSFCLEAIGKVVLLPEIVSIYRRTGSGICSSQSQGTFQISAIVEIMQLYTISPRKEYKITFAKNLMARIRNIMHVKVEELLSCQRRARWLFLRMYLILWIRCHLHAFIQGIRNDARFVKDIMISFNSRKANKI